MSSEVDLLSGVVLLLPLNFCLLWILFSLSSDANERLVNWGRAFLLAAISWGIVCVIITEVLSAFHHLAPAYALSLWACLTLVAGSLLLWRTWRGALPRCPPVIHPLSSFTRVILVYVVGVIVIVGLVAGLSPPHNTDAMRYHLPRIMHWIQNQTVQFYPTHTVEQLGLSPGAEYAILQFQLLSRSDRFANLIQWFSMLGCFVALALVVRGWGGSLRAVLFSVVVLASMPLGILQASSAKNEYVVAFWLLCFVYFIAGQDDFTWRAQLAAGGSLGLAILTKQTAYIYLLPWVGLCGVQILRSWQRRSLHAALVVVSLAVAINLPQMARSYSLFGSPFGAVGDPKLTNDVVTPALFVSTLVKNLSVQMQTPSAWFSYKVEGATRRFHALIGVEVNDPRNTVQGTSFSVLQTNFHDMVSANPLHFVLILLTITICLATPELRANRQLLTFTMAPVASYLIFTFVLRHHVSNLRYQFPIFVLFAAPVGFFIANVVSRKMGNGLIILLVIASVPWVLWNQTRPLFGEDSILRVPRRTLYFAARPMLRGPYLGAMEFVRSRHCSQIGLDLRGTHWEYPFWIGMEKQGPFRIEHVNVGNVSATALAVPPAVEFVPCAVVMVDTHPIERLEATSRPYTLSWSSESTTFGSVRVYQLVSSPVK